MPISTSRLCGLGSKRTVLTTGLLGAALLLVSGTQPWVVGSVADAVLGTSAARGTGSQVGPAAVAAGLVAGAAAIAGATSGALVRRICALALLLAAVLSAVVVGAVAADPSGALRGAASTALGRRDTVQATGHAAPWLWVAAVGAVLLAVAGVGAVAGGRRWAGLSTRYDAPTADAEGTGRTEPADIGSGPARTAAPDGTGGERPAGRTPTPWELLSAGGDPTLEEPSPDAEPGLGSAPQPEPSPPGRQRAGGGERQGERQSGAQQEGRAGH